MILDISSNQGLLATEGTILVIRIVNKIQLQFLNICIQDLTDFTKNVPFDSHST